MLERYAYRIDLLNRIDGVGFEEGWDTRLELSVPVESKTIPLFMLSLDKLLQTKRAIATRDGNAPEDGHCATCETC